jgi:hypothetical protein
MRKANGTDFHVDVDGVGRFTFGRRTMRDVFLIRSEYNRLSNGNYNAEGIPVDMGAWAVSTVFVLLVASPAEFDLGTIDPLTDDTWEEKTAKVFNALRDMELSFRKNSPPAVQKAGP